MKNKITTFINGISFQSQTNILVWLIICGFTLIVSVGLLALIGLKNEFDLSAPQNHNTYSLILLAQDIEKKQNVADLLEIWEQYKAQNNDKNTESTITNLRKWYAKTFMPEQHQQVQNLLEKEHLLIESLEKVVKHNDTLSVYALLKEQINTSFSISVYNKSITDSLYKDTFIVLSIFMSIVIATIFIFTLFIRRSINANHLLLEQLVDSKTKELRILNANLQKTIEYEVAQSHKKDLVMYQQARLASMGEMIQNIAHQWRQPLNSLMMLIQSFKSKASQDKLENEFVLQQTQYGMKIATEMSNTIENFRNFFRPETNKEFFEPSVSIWNAIDIIREQLKENFIEANVIIQKENLRINGYENSFMQVVLVLINNAIDALKLKAQNEENFKNLHIEILLDKLGYNLSLRVRDNAGGIHLEDKSKIFEPYFTTKHKSVGTGVGLYMAKQIIESQFSGTISVSNVQWGQEYIGAEFNINIPTQEQHNET